MTDKHLARCPCGATPKRLIQHLGGTIRWQHVSGDCCGEWQIEANRPKATGHGSDLTSPVNVAAARAAWNGAPRANGLSKIAAPLPSAIQTATDDELIGELIRRHPEGHWVGGHSGDWMDDEVSQPVDISDLSFAGDGDG